MATVETSKLLATAKEILSATQEIVKTLESKGSPEPSWDEVTSQDLYETKDEVVKAAKIKVLDLTSNLRSLINGPVGDIRQVIMVHFDCAALRSVLEFEILKHIPAGGSATAGSLAKAVDLDTDKVYRMLRLLATRHITQEIEVGVFKHTAISRRLADDWELTAQVLMQLDEMNKASAFTTEYLKAKPHCLKSHDSPFSFYHGKAFYEWYDDHPVLAARFGAAQEGIAKMDRSFKSVFLWLSQSGLEPGAKIVDVGGGNGVVTVGMAQAFPKYNYVLQDLYPKFFEETYKGLNADLKSRINSVQHDFFTPQPVDNAVGAYLLRSCCHNWSDEDCLKLIAGFGTALKENPKAKLLINECIVPKSGEAPLQEEIDLLEVDIAMMVIANSKQRSEADWHRLVADAKCGLLVEKIVQDNESMGIIQVGYKGE